VVVTGQGVVSSIGIGVDRFWANMRRGFCGIAPISNIDKQDLYITIAGEVKDFDSRERCPSKPLMLADRYSQFAGASAIEAMKTGRFQRTYRRRTPRCLDHWLRHRWAVDHGNRLCRSLHSQEESHPPADAVA